MEPETFRTVIWSKLLPLFALPFLALFLAIWPLSDSWGRSTWIALGVVAALAVGAYLVRTWQRAIVWLDDGGIHVAEGVGDTLTWDRLLGLTRFGRYRVRLCMGERATAHAHASIDVWSAADFADALEDWHEHVTGKALDDLHAPAA
jgi:hypothetical protein